MGLGLGRRGGCSGCEQLSRLLGGGTEYGCTQPIWELDVASMGAVDRYPAKRYADRA